MENVPLEFLKALNHTRDLRALGKLLLEHAISLVPQAQTGTLLVLDEAEGVFKFRAAVGWNLAKLSQARIPKDKMLQKILYQDTPAIVRNPHELNREYLPKEVAEMLAEFPVAAFLTFPIAYEGKIIAYFNLDNKQDPNAFSQSDFKRLEGVREGIALAVRTAMDWERLVERESELRNLLSALPDAVVTIDAEGRIRSWNPGAAKLFGYSQEEVLGRPVTLLMPEEYKKRHEEVFKKNLANGRAEHRLLEVEGLRKDGTRFPVQWAIASYEGKGRRCFVGVGRDLTARVEAERRLRESERRFHLFFERLADAVYITRFDGTILEANPAAARQSGYTREELIGMNIMRDLAAEEPAITYETANEKLARGETIYFEERKRRKDGVEYWTECAVTPIEYQGRPATLSVNRDVTARKKAEARLRGVYRLSRGLALSKSKDEVCERVVQIGHHLLGAQVCAVFLLDKEAKELRLVTAYGLPQESIGRTVDLTHGASPVAEVIRTGRWLYLSDLSASAFGDEDLFGEGAKLLIPLMVKRKILGVFAAVSTEPNGFSRGDIRLFGALVNQAAVALAAQEAMEAVRQSEQTQRELRGRLEELHLAARELGACASEEEVWRNAIRAARNILGFDECDLAVREGDELVSRANLEGLSPPGAPRIHKDQGGIAWRTIQEGRTLFGDPADFPEAVAAEEYRSFISVPIGERGVFQAAAKRENAFTEDDVRMAELLVGHVEEALRRVELENELRAQAIRDPLTGLYNRRYLAEMLEREWERAKRYGHPFALLIMDIDNFKLINDRFGHLRGDEVLKGVAQLICRTVRETDLLFRYGGDEFLIILPEMNGSAQCVATRLRRAFARWCAEEGLDELKIGLSTGVGIWDPSVEKSVDQLLREADEAMYRAKRKHTSQS